MGAPNFRRAVPEFGKRGGIRIVLDMNGRFNLL